MKPNIGEIFPTSNGDVKIIEYNAWNDVLVEFIETGYRTKTYTKNLYNGVIKDHLKPSVAGVGYIGKGPYKISYKGKHPTSYAVWNSILQRCYNPNCKEYPIYGSKGVTVCTEWHNYQNFAKWYSQNSFENCHVDKDIKGNSLEYSPNNCICTTPKSNTEKANARFFKFRSPTGDEVEIYNLTDFCRNNMLSQSSMSNVFHGKQKSHKGWTIC